MDSSPIEILDEKYGSMEFGQGHLHNYFNYRGKKPGRKPGTVDYRSFPMGLVVFRIVSTNLASEC